MSIANIFSTRNHKADRTDLDVYSYDDLPQKFRVQFVHIMRDLLGSLSEEQYEDLHRYSIIPSYTDTQERERLISQTYRGIIGTLAREYGLFRLGPSDNPVVQVVEFFLRSPEYENCLDLVELVLQTAELHLTNPNFLRVVHPKVSISDAVLETNQRFQESAIGYQYEAGRIIRIDSSYQHSELIKPVLELFSDKRFAGAQDEFLKAHEHFRRGATKEAVNEAAKCFESTLKIICTLKEWSFPAKATAKPLVEIVMKNAFVPSYLQSQFTSLQNPLESGAPVLRNNESAHGQGAELRTVPRHVASLALNLTASYVTFLVRNLEP